jgi:hypothetical protein
MSPRFLFRSSGMALLLGSLFGLSWTVMSALILPLADPNQFASPFFLIASWLMFFAAVAIVPGLVGWYASQSARAGWLGFVGFALVFFGVLVLGVGFGFISATVIPWLTTHAPELLVGALPPLLTLCALVSALMVGVGTIPLGFATMRAGVLPRWPGLLLILSGAAGLLGLLPLPYLKNIPAIASAVLLFLGLGWAGYALWREPVAQKSTLDRSVASPHGA